MSEQKTKTPSCAGCNVQSDSLPEYNEENLIEDDRTFSNGKFVCDKCYCRLGRMGIEIGSGEELRARAEMFLSPPPTSVKMGGIDIPVITSLTLEDAVKQGILVITGTIGVLPVVFNGGLFKERGFDKDPKGLEELISKGLDALAEPDDEGQEGGTRLRVLEKDKLWVMHNGNTITFLRPEDY